MNNEPAVLAVSYKCSNDGSTPTMKDLLGLLIILLPNTVVLLNRLYSVQLIFHWFRFQNESRFLIFFIIQTSFIVKNIFVIKKIFRKLVFVFII